MGSSTPFQLGTSPPHMQLQHAVVDMSRIIAHYCLILEQMKVITGNSFTHTHYGLSYFRFRSSLRNSSKNMVEIHSGTQNVRVRLSGGSMLFIASYI